MPAQYVKPYVKTNKNDYIDAEAYRRGSRPSHDALRTDQDGRATGSAVPSPGTRTLGYAVVQR